MSKRAVYLTVGIVVLVAVVVAGVIWLQGSQDDSGSDGIQILSTFAQGEAIPVRYTCDGEDISPAMAWSGLPEESQSLALTVEDPDAPGGTFVHWVIFDIPAVLTGLAENVVEDGVVPGVGVQGTNDFQALGYGGPCPPQRSQHAYVFTLYALDQLLNLEPGVDLAAFKTAAKGHVLKKVKLTGNYARQ